MTSFLERLLEYYSLTISDYYKLTQDIKSINLPSYDTFKGIVKVKEYFLNTFDSHKKIIIYGDYDCDGIMSTAIMSILFKRYNVDFDYYIPLRNVDGYGLTKEKVDEFKSEGYQIILCVDNGISLVEVVDYANSLGLEVIIFDHHSADLNNLPKAKHILHPEVSNFGDPNTNISAGAVCFYFSWCLLGRIDEYLLSLAAISTISDMMPLRDYNRNLVRLGLNYINNNRYENIFKLVDGSFEINEDSIALKIAPKVNSIGRLILDDTNKDVVKYFVDYENESNNEILLWINDTNNKRKKLVQNFKYDDKASCDKSGILIYDSTIDEGICGLIANKLMAKYNKASLVLTDALGEEGIIKGSLRASDGFDVIEFYEKVKDILLNHGGHEHAGGLSLKYDNLDKFSEEFYDFADSHPFIKKTFDETIEIEEKEINAENYHTLISLSPFGQEFKEPTFKIKDFPIRLMKKSKDGKHLLFFDWKNNSSISYFNFNPMILENYTADLIGKLQINFYNGRTTYQFIVETFE